MKIDLNKVSYDGKWFDHGDARVKIRPYPASRSDVAIKDGAMIFAGDAGFDMFSYCLEAWEGVSDADGKELKLSPEIKKKVFDFGLGSVDGLTLSAFVIQKARQLSADIEADAKN